MLVAGVETSNRMIGPVDAFVVGGAWTTTTSPCNTSATKGDGAGGASCFLSSDSWQFDILLRRARVLKFSFQRLLLVLAQHFFFLSIRAELCVDGTDSAVGATEAFGCCAAAVRKPSPTWLL